MPADIDAELAQAVAIERQMEADLLIAFQRERRSARRAISRDLARRYPIAPKPPTYDRGPDAKLRLPIRLSRRNHEARIAGVQQQMVTGERVPVSGRARRDVKRAQRADFWFRFKIAADDRADAQVLADLNARMLDLSWPLPQ